MKQFLCCLAWFFGSILLITVVTPASIVAQYTVVSSESQCDTCRIVVSPLVALLDSTGVPFGSTRSVVRDSRGLYYLYHSNRNGQVSVFDSTGSLAALLGSSDGHSGQYGNIMELAVSAGDTLRVFDARLRRQTVLGPRHRVARVLPLPGPLRGAVLLPDGHVVINASIRTAAEAGLPLHLVSPNGVLKSSFGTDDETLRPDLPWIQHRVLAGVRGDTAVWAAHYSQYRIELWHVDAHRLAGLERTVSWFSPWLRGEVIRDSLPPRPFVRDIRESPDGYLWILIAVPDSGWKDHLKEIDTPDGKRIWPDQWESVYDTMVEVIDPVNARLVTSVRLPEYLMLFVDGCSCAAAYTGSHLGPSSLRIVELRLQR